MTPFPVPLADFLGHWGQYIVYFVIGIAFGAVLEMAGFGVSNKLAAQFYLKEMTVLKVMFMGIVVAMVLIFAASGLGLLDYNRIWVNPTYLWPGIVGGLIMGVGFIVGGFCPGTSLVAVATAKIDGIFFFLGTLFGIFVFGEVVSKIEDFFYSSYMGRFTIPDLLNVDTGLVVAGITIMALGIFYVVEKVERLFGNKEPRLTPRWRFGAASVIAVVSLAVAIIGQPTLADRYSVMASEKETQIRDRTVQIHPGELLASMHNHRINLKMIDVRSESDYNDFHILDAVHVNPSEIPDLISGFVLEPDNTLFVVISNDERAATDAWKVLVAGSVQNVYILEGGINEWLDTFASEDFKANYRKTEAASAPEDVIRYTFTSALGSRNAAASPNPKEFVLEYTPKVQIKSKAAAKGGCG